MATPKKYFHDHLVLLLLSVNVFLALAGSLYVLLRLSTSHGTGYIVQCRDCSNPAAISRFTNGSVVGILALVVFMLMALAIHVMLSLGTYKIHRQLAVIILALGVLLLTLAIIVSNALLVLR
jgi:hypothetical protein